MPKRRVAAASLGLILACAAYAQVSPIGLEAQRQRLAVLDFPLDEAYAGPGTVRDLQDRLRERIERQLTHGRRFAVLDLGDSRIDERAKGVFTSPDPDPAERALLGRALGADLVLYGTVDRFAVQAMTLTIRISGERLERLAGTSRMRVKLLDVATEEVTWADSFEVERLSPERSAQRLADALLDELARQVVAALTERIDPIVVAGDGDGDGIPDYLNRGANPQDYNRDGLPDYLNRYFLQRRPLQTRLRSTGAR